MRTLTIVPAWARSFIVAALVLAAGSAGAENLKLVTEDYPPFNYREDGTHRGTSVEQVDIVMKAAELPYTVEILPWARALALAERQPMHCVFSTAHTPERHPHFKWVEPLSTGRTLLVRKSGYKADPNTLDEARAYRVGTQLDDFTVDLLRKRGFDNLDLASDFSLTFKKLMLGRVDFMPISEENYAKLRRQGMPIQSVLVLSEEVYSLACHKSVPDDSIARMQAALDGLIADGTQARIFRKHGLIEDSQ